VTTYATTRTVRFDATAIAAVVALLLSALALVVALSDRHATTAAVSTGSRATTTVATTSAVAATAGNLTRQQAIAHAMRVDAAGSKFASSNVTSTRIAATSTTVNPYWSKIKIMDAHRTS
jgi:hypothetical protein